MLLAHVAGELPATHTFFNKNFYFKIFFTHLSEKTLSSQQINPT